MSKDHQRGNKEAKKPKQKQKDLPAQPATTAAAAAPSGAAMGGARKPQK